MLRCLCRLQDQSVKRKVQVNIADFEVMEIFCLPNGYIICWNHSSQRLSKVSYMGAVSGWFWAGWDCVRQLLFARPLNTPPPSPPRPVSPIYNKVGASHHCRVSDTHNKVQFHKVYWHTEHSTQLQSGGGRLNRICVSGAGNQLSVK